MLLLVLAHGHPRRLVEEDVRGHEIGIGVKADSGVVAPLARLLLELRHAVEPAEPGDAVEYPGQFGVTGDPALVEDDTVLRVDPRRKQPGARLASVRRELRRVLRHGDRVQIDDAIDAVVTALQPRPIADRAEIVSEMQIARRLHAREDPFHPRSPPARRRRRGNTRRRRAPSPVSRQQAFEIPAPDRARKPGRQREQGEAEADDEDEGRGPGRFSACEPRLSRAAASHTPTAIATADAATRGARR